MRSADLAPPLEAIDLYSKVDRRLREASNTELDCSIQTDCSIPLETNTVNRSIGTDAAEAVELLLSLTPFHAGPPAIASHRERFVGQFNQGREVALLDLLDAETGLGPLNVEATPQTTPLQERRARILTRVACDALRQRKSVIELTDDLLASLEPWDLGEIQTPNTLDIFALVGARSETDIDEGNYQFVIGPNVGASVAGRNLGRFAYLLGDEGVSVLKHYASLEHTDADDIIGAELLFEPDVRRLTNVVLRPPIRRYEISPGGFGDNADVTRIPLNELCVGVHDNKYYLRWQRTGQIVKPFSGHVLNPQHAPEAFRFLGELSHDGIAQLYGFSWGPAENFPFLPRVQRGRIVLRPAEWRVDKCLGGTVVQKDSFDDFRRVFREWCREWDLPQHVYLTDSDNRLLLDTKSTPQIEELFHSLRNTSEDYLRIQEAVPSPHSAWLRGPKGRYCSEFVVSLRREKKHLADNRGPLTLLRQPATAAVRPPGTEWLYAKLYCHSCVQNEIISNYVLPFSQSLVANHHANKWFFLRYHDERAHLRVRVNGDPQSLNQNVFPAFTQLGNELIERGLVVSMSFDTYDREVERYGGPNAIEWAEELFFWDSNLVATLISLEQAKQLDSGLDDAMILSMNAILGLFFTAPEALGWMKQVVRWRGEFGREYREKKNTLRRLLGEDKTASSDQADKHLYRDVLEQFKLSAKPCVELMKAARDDGRLTVQLEEIAGSIIHMHFNRMHGGGTSAERRFMEFLLRTLDGLAAHPYQDSTA